MISVARIESALSYYAGFTAMTPTRTSTIPNNAAKRGIAPMPLLNQVQPTWSVEGHLRTKRATT